jgi:integrase
MARKSFKASYVELRYNTYYAVYYVPKDVHHILGKVKFYKSTRTSELKLAESRAAALVLGWKAQVDAARLKYEDPVIRSARDLLSQSKDPQKSLIVSEIIDEEEFKIRTAQGDLAADIFKDVASGQQQVLQGLMLGWKEHQRAKGLAEKTIDQMFSDVEILISTFPTANCLKHQYVEWWINDIAVKGNLSASSVTRILGSCRNFFKYLQFIGEVSKSETDPFIVPDQYKISKKPNSKSINKTQSWLPFSTESVVSLYKQAVNQGDNQLGDLIMIGAYTGARIEEICSLKCDHINLNEESISIVDSKTEAGQRILPIHSKIKNKIIELVNQSLDGYLLSGLTLNKYNDRSNAIGKRFGRLKKKSGYSERYVFHSIRKTFTTMLENADVSENLAADIVGHEKPRITYGLYSGGATLALKKEAIEKVSYDFN